MPRLPGIPGTQTAGTILGGLQIGESARDRELRNKKMRQDLALGIAGLALDAGKTGVGFGSDFLRQQQAQGFEAGQAEEQRRFLSGEGEKERAARLREAEIRSKPRVGIDLSNIKEIQAKTKVDAVNNAVLNGELTPEEGAALVEGIGSEDPETTRRILGIQTLEGAKKSDSPEAKALTDFSISPSIDPQTLARMAASAELSIPAGNRDLVFGRAAEEMLRRAGGAEAVASRIPLETPAPVRGPTSGAFLRRFGGTGGAPFAVKNPAEIEAAEAERRLLLRLLRSGGGAVPTPFSPERETLTEDDLRNLLNALGQ